MTKPNKRLTTPLVSSTEQAAILSYINDAIIRYDSTFKIIFWNQAAEKIYGYSAAEALGQPSSLLKPTYTISREHLLDTILREGHLETESGRQTKDGRQIIIEAHVISLTDAEGNNTGFIALDRDITQRKREEESLREARDYLDNLFNYANAPIIVWNPQFEITRFNHAFEYLTGITAAEALGKKLDILFPDESRDVSMDLIRKTSSGERWESVEIPIQHRDCTVRIVLWNSATIYGPDQITAIATIAQGQDITERKKAENDLRETRDYLNNLFNYANAPIIVWNPRFKITRFNHAFEYLTGFTAAEALGKKLDILFPDESRNISMDLIRKTSSGERWESVEIPIRHRDGTVRIVLWNSATIYGLDRNTAIATIAQGQDITRRKKAEVDLKDSEEKFRTVLENSRDGINMLDLATGRYVFISPAQIELTGFTEQEMMNLSAEEAYERIHPDDREISVKQQQRVIAGEDLSEPVEYRWKVKSGEYRWFSDRRKLVRDEAGRPVALVGISRDITESKRLLERLAAQERLAYLGRMAGTIAHEVRNPLAVIDSSAYYLERKLSGTDEKITSHLQRMRDGVTRASAIIEKLLEMSRMRQPQITKINLNTFISKAIQQANIPHTVKVSFLHCPDTIEIMADVEQLGMALGNLIRNAVEAMENSGTLTIGLSKVNNVIEIFIADTGPGIPDNNMSRMFEPLFTTKPGGVGFGLALVKTVVERHNGKISVKSEPGKGAKFTIYLTQSPEQGV